MGDRENVDQAKIRRRKRLAAREAAGELEGAAKDREDRQLQDVGGDAGG